MSPWLVNQGGRLGAVACLHRFQYLGLQSRGWGLPTPLAQFLSAFSTISPFKGQHKGLEFCPSMDTIRGDGIKRSSQGATILRHIMKQDLSSKVGSDMKVAGWGQYLQEGAGGGDLDGDLPHDDMRGHNAGLVGLLAVLVHGGDEDVAHPPLQHLDLQIPSLHTVDGRHEAGAVALLAVPAGTSAATSIRPAILRFGIPCGLTGHARELRSQNNQQIFPVNFRI